MCSSDHYTDETTFNDLCHCSITFEMYFYIFYGAVRKDHLTDVDVGRVKADVYMDSVPNRIAEWFVLFYDC
jgi:hypothetical protein